MTRLFALFKASDEASLQLNPLDALFRGDLRYADRFGDMISDDYFAASRAAAARDLAALAGDRPRAAQPDRPDRLRQLRLWTRDALARLDPALVALTAVRPINHFSGLQTYYPTLSSGKGAAPFATVADYDNALKRHDGYADYLDAAIARFRQGQAAGVVDTKLTIRNVIEQLETQLAQPLEQSAFFGPVQPVSRRDRRRRPRAADRRLSRDGRQPHLSRLSPAARLSARTTISPPRARRSGCRR